MTAANRDRATRLALSAVTISTLVWSVLALGLAGLAAFGRRNWARWIFIVVFVLREMHGMTSMARFSDSIAMLLPDPRRDLSFYATKLILLAAIAFVVTGNAREWFRRQLSFPAERIRQDA